MKDFEFIAENSRNDPVSFISNPINGFILIKKMSRDLSEIFDLLAGYPDFKSSFIKILKTFKFKFMTH
jgi:hypothetical protein